MKLDKSLWKKFRFDEIAFHISERVEPSQTNAEIYVGLEHLDPESIHITRFGKPSEVKGTKLKVYKGDVIFGKRRAYQRKAAVANFDGICSAHAMVLRANPKVIMPELFPFFLHSDTFMNCAVDISEGSLSPTIKWKMLAEQEFIIPPLEKQRELTELLLKGDLLLQNLSRLFIKFNLYQATQLNNYFQKITEKKLEEFGQIIRGVSYKPDDLRNNHDNESFVLLRANNIRNLQVNFDDIYYINKDLLKKDQILKKGDIIICTANGNPELVGKAAILHEELKNITAVGTFCIVFRPHSQYQEFCHIFFSCDIYAKLLKPLVLGTNIINLRPNDLLKLKIPLLNKDLDPIEVYRYFKEMLRTKKWLDNYDFSLKTSSKIVLNQIFSNEV